MANNNNTKNLNVPNLRFPEFKGEWKTAILGDIVKSISSGKTKPSEGEYNLYGSTGIIGRTPKPDYKGEMLLVARVGANAGYLQLINEQCGITDNTLIVVPTDVPTKYLYYFLLHLNLNRLVFGSGQPLITGGMLKKIKVQIGTKKEQDKISNLLSLLDERTTTQNKIIEDLKKLKSAVITVIFTTTNGVNYQLKDLAKFIGGGTPSSNDSSYWSGDIPWISSSDVSEDNINKITITRHITNEAIKKSATQICESPCILIVSRVGVGKVALSNISLCTSQDFCNLTKIKCNPKFLAYQLQSIMKRKSYAVQGTSIKGITTEEIKKTGIMLPSIEKQLSIASTLSRIDTFIDVEISILENYQKLRKYLLQQMFI